MRQLDRIRLGPLIIRNEPLAKVQITKVDEIRSLVTDGLNSVIELRIKLLRAAKT